MQENKIPKKYFDEIDIYKLNTWKKELFQENQYIDFKLSTLQCFKDNVHNPKEIKNKINAIEKDKKTLTEAITGFANTQGGVLIFGVSCKKNKTTKVDTIEALNPIDDIDDFKSKIFASAISNISPQVFGIENKIIRLLSDNLKGYLVIYTPSSITPPHMNNYDNSYYMRSADSFVKMNHNLVSAIFNKKQSSKIQVLLKNDIEYSVPNIFRYNLMLLNVGNIYSEKNSITIFFTNAIISEATNQLEMQRCNNVIEYDTLIANSILIFPRDNIYKKMGTFIIKKSIITEDIILKIIISHENNTHIEEFILVPGTDIEIIEES
jgi:hypothetical protein